MRLTNRKLRKPMVEECFQYTEEEQAEVKASKELLQRAEANLSQANAAWRGLASMSSAFLMPPGLVASKISFARHNRYMHRKMLREAYVRYVQAVLPPRLIAERAGKIISEYIKERLSQSSLAERLLPKAGSST